MRLKRLKRAIKSHERIRVISSKNKSIRFRPDQNVVLKVYDTKKRKYVGTLNKVKRGKPIPRKFGKTQYKMYQLQRSSKYFRAGTEGASFKVKSSRHVKYQIPDRVLRDIRKNSIRKNGKAFQINIDYRDTKGIHHSYTKNPAWLLTNRVDNDDIRKIITNEVVALAVLNNRRFSGKLLTRPVNKRKKLIRHADIKITYISRSQILGGKSSERKKRKTKKLHSHRKNRKLASKSRRK